MTRTQVRRLIVGVLALVVAFSAGIVVGGKGLLAGHLDGRGLPAFVAGAVSGVPPEGVNFSPVWRAWNILDDRFVDTHVATTTHATSTESGTLDDPTQERIWGMIQGLANSTGDPYTVFLPPSEAEIFQDDINGSFEGVGMEISIRNNILTVVSPLKGTPAAKSGIKSGDRIIEIDGKSTKNMGINTAVQLIRGKKGTDVKFRILREEVGMLEISVTRDTIKIPTIETHQRGDGIFVIELMNFSAQSSELFRQALSEFRTTNYNKLIIDLRGNPGGFLEASIDMASWFLPAGKIVVTEDFGEEGEKRVHRSRGYDIFNENLEIVFLVDRGTASASEILAGSLREHGVATLVGTNTFGKGSVQELVPVTKETSLKVTVARWLLAGDVFITQHGLEPDIIVEIPDEEIQEGTDRDFILERAVKFLHQQ